MRTKFRKKNFDNEISFSKSDNEFANEISFSKSDNEFTNEIRFLPSDTCKSSSPT